MVNAMPFTIERITVLMHIGHVIENACALLTILCGFRDLRKPILAAKAATTLSTAFDYRKANECI